MDGEYLLAYTKFPVLNFSGNLLALWLCELSDFYLLIQIFFVINGKA